MLVKFVIDPCQMISTLKAYCERKMNQCRYKNINCAINFVTFCMNLSLSRFHG